MMKLLGFPVHYDVPMALPADDVANAARAFFSAALEVLEDQHVVPPPAFHPYLEVGRDYYGPDLTPLAEYEALEDIIKRAHRRFGADVPLGEREFAASYTSTFLEACLALSTVNGEPL